MGTPAHVIPSQPACRWWLYCTAKARRTQRTAFFFTTEALRTRRVTRSHPGARCTAVQFTFPEFLLERRDVARRKAPCVLRVLRASVVKIRRSSCPSCLRGEFR